MSSHALKIAAAIIVDDEARLLLVRKHGSRYFMQAGGKIDAGETPAEALAREVSEELGVTLTNWEDPVEASAEAANEAGCFVEAHLFWATIEGNVAAAAEIEEVCWATLEQARSLPLAALTRDAVLPIIEQRLKRA